MNKIAAALLCVSLAAFPTAVQADLIIKAGPDGGPFGGLIGPKNDLVGKVVVDGATVPNPLHGYYGATIGYTADVTHLEFIYHGSEAGYHNEFQLNFADGGWGIAEDALGNKFKNNGGTDYSNDVGNNNPLPRSTGLIGVGALNPGDDYFRFNIVKSNGTQLGTVHNALNPNDSDDDGDKNFFAAIWEDSVLLFLDDSGAGPDDNHDDMVVQIKAYGGPSGVPEVVPEPTSLALFSLMGLGALGATGRRRRRSETVGSK